MALGFSGLPVTNICPTPIIGCGKVICISENDFSDNKQGYYVNMTICDSEGNELCSDICRPMSDFINPEGDIVEGLGKVCFEVSAIIRNLGLVSSNMYETPLISSADMVVEEESYCQNFIFKFKGEYTDTDSESGCERVETNEIETPEITFINYVDNGSEVDFRLCSGGLVTAVVEDDISDLNNVQTAKHKFCINDCIQVKAYNPSGVSVIFVNAVLVYEDGSQATYSNIPGIANTPCFSINLCLSLMTLNPISTGTFQGAIKEIMWTIGGSLEGSFFTEIDTEFCNCGGCRKQMKFLSTCGTWESATVSCDKKIVQNTKHEYACKSYKCYDADGGVTVTGTSKNEKVNTVYIRSFDPDYISKFIESPCKMVCEDDGSWTLIRSTEESVTIFEDSERDFFLFTYSFTTLKTRRLLNKSNVQL
jgi:hypothetical protein